MQLNTAVLCCLLLSASVATADGTVVTRMTYYKERATRVIQPMIDGTFGVGDEAEVKGHFLVDAITSASVASGAGDTAFTEKRYEGGLGGSFKPAEKMTFGGAFKVSDEPDYRSLYAGVNSTFALANNNFELSAAFGIAFDTVSNAGAANPMVMPFERDLNTYLTSVSVSQVFSQTTVASLTYDFIVADGFQANPYRVVVAGGTVVPERVPDRRYRSAILAQLKQYVVPAKATLIAEYRFYIDDWGVIAHTPGVRWIQEIGEDVRVHTRVRYHRQRGADFYELIYDSADPMVNPYVVDDVKLSSFWSMTIGGRVEMKLKQLGLSGYVGEVSGLANFDYLIQRNRFGNAIAASVGLSLPIDY